MVSDPPSRGERYPLARPFLQALDLIQERDGVSLDELSRRARAGVEQHFGASDRPVNVGTAVGSTALLAEHVRYFDGFAVLLTALPGAAVAVRRSATPGVRVVVEEPADGAGDAGEARGRTALVEAVASWLLPAGAGLDVVAVVAVPPTCVDALLAALGVALVRAIEPTLGEALPPHTMLHGLRELIATVSGVPAGLAHLIASATGTTGTLTLVDTTTLEHLPLEMPAPDQVAWALVEVGQAFRRTAPYYHEQLARADEALDLLRRGEFAQLGSLRDLEHRDLQRALALLPRRLRPVVRFLVSENRRVSKLVFAVRRKDWQMFGALLLMSYATLKQDAGVTGESTDLVVAEVERMTVDGMYGACFAGRGGCVLAVGQPFVVPGFLEQLRSAYRQQFGSAPCTMLL